VKQLQENSLMNEMSEISIGTIFSSPNDRSPNVDHYLFILDENAPLLCRQGIYCYTYSGEGMLVGRVDEILVSNEYYNNPQTVKKFDGGALYGISNSFPTERWEDYIGLVKILGVFPYEEDSSLDSSNPRCKKIVQRPAFPGKPGNKVIILDGDNLRDFLGITPDGLNLGTLEHYNIDVRLNLNRLINKHFAVLAMSGAGKSYLISVILEELLLRNNSMGTPGVLLIDVHGEYKYLSDQSVTENRHFALKTNYYDGRYFQIDVGSLSAFDIATFQPNISNAQVRDLKKIIDKIKSSKKQSEGAKTATITTTTTTNTTTTTTGSKSYDLNDLISYLDLEPNINQKVREALVGWLYDLQRLELFTNTEMPVIKNIIKPGHLTILDLSNVISIRKKQIIVAYLAEKLFFMRRSGMIPPYLMILEEAHQFAPESMPGETAIAKNIIETIAREGRKFFAQICLISQRPVKLSTTALSQCNTHIILRVTNPNDLNHIKQSSEALTNESLKMIATLPTGNALVMGSATNLPLFIKIRQRFSSDPFGEKNLEEICKQFQNPE
jgi:DNA helicase HerA-like ATPase